MLDNLKRIEAFMWLFVAAVLIGAIYGINHAYQRYQSTLPTAPVGLNIVATPAPEVKKVTPVDKPIKAKTVKVYPAAVKNTIKLPQIIQDNPDLDVIASNQVPADDHPQTITTLINTETGESQTFVKRDPLPWLAVDTRGEAGMYMGIKNGEPTARIEVKQGLLQVKALHFGVTAAIDQPISGTQSTDYFIGTGAWVRW